MKLKIRGTSSRWLLATGFPAEAGFRGYAVAETTEHIRKLIAAAPAVIGPGFFVPVRNGALLLWLFDSGFCASWSATLMTYGRHGQIADAFMPSIAF